MLYNNIDLADAPSPAFAMCTYITGVEFGTYSNGTFSWADKAEHKEADLLELHIFNETKEFRAIISGQKPVLTLTIEEDKSKYDDYLDEHMRFFGEEYVETDGNITKLIDKGCSKDFYLSITKEQFYDGITLGVRNYIKYDENDMIQIVNYRLLGLFSGKSEAERKERGVLAYGI
ncbi:MAG: CRISPR-associated protein Csx19 [Oscillospiraceae bacterium]|nr:CRISPR-associated protein Csx19 [Oscillospiraceae bacterium]